MARNGRTTTARRDPPQRRSARDEDDIDDQGSSQPQSGSQAVRVKAEKVAKARRARDDVEDDDDGPRCGSGAGAGGSDDEDEEGKARMREIVRFPFCLRVGVAFDRSCVSFHDFVTVRSKNSRRTGKISPFLPVRPLLIFRFVD